MRFFKDLLIDRCRYNLRDVPPWEPQFEQEFVPLAKQDEIRQRIIAAAEFTGEAFETDMQSPPSGFSGGVTVVHVRKEITSKSTREVVVEWVLVLLVGAAAARAGALIAGAVGSYWSIHVSLLLDLAIVGCLAILAMALTRWAVRAYYRKQQLNRALYHVARRLGARRR